MGSKVGVDDQRGPRSEPRVEYRNLRSRLLLQQAFARQFVIPLGRPPALLERTLRWYEQRVLKVDTSAIQIDRPIFLVGLPRSGTTMVQDIICAHPDIGYVTNSMHEFRSCFCAAEHVRKRLRLDFTGERYILDGMEIRLGSPNEGHRFLADWLQVDPYSLSVTTCRLEDFPDRKVEELREIIRRVLWCYDGKANRFFNKRPGLLTLLPFIHAWFPDARIIHLVRDARMCANSMIKLYRRHMEQEARIRAELGEQDHPSGPFVPYPRIPKLREYIDAYGCDDIRTTANVWNDSISLVNDAKADVPFCYEVRYEDILANPKTEIAKLMEFCELPDVADRGAPFWRKVDEIRAGSAPGQYAGFEVVEAICRENMRKYGYL